MAFLEVPFSFERVGFYPRARIETPQIMTAMALAEIREVAECDAPIVANCRFPSMRLVPGPKTPVWQQVDVDTDYRLLDGRLMRRAVFDASLFSGGGYGRSVPGTFQNVPLTRMMVEADGVLDVTRATAQQAMRLLETMMPRGAPGVVLRKPGDAAPRGRGCLEADTPFARNLSDDRRMRSNEAATAMTVGAAFVGGVLYMPSWGPAWCVDLDGREGATACAEPELGWLTRNDAESAYLGDQMPVIAEMAARKQKVVQFSGEIEVYEPSAMPIPPDEFALRALCHDVITTGTLAEFGGCRSAAGIHAYADMIALVDDHAANVDALPGVCRAIGDAWLRIIPAGDPRHWKTQRIDEVLERVDVRRALEAGAPAPPRPRP